MTALEPESFWQRARQVAQSALELGTLRPIPTEIRFIDERNTRFLVRVATDWNARDRAESRGNDQQNPFLPYAPTLHVADVGQSHVCLLNKYCVVDTHLLIVTRQFEDQTELLTKPDFEALASCLAGGDGLAFYNAGKTAGASQRHKHMQLVPLPRLDRSRLAPLTPMLETAVASQTEERILQSDHLPFAHRLAGLGGIDWGRPRDAAARLARLYERLLFEQGVGEPASYNLLITSDWMMVVPRGKEKFGSISINSLGFVGAFFARTEDQLRELQDAGPSQALSFVA